MADEKHQHEDHSRLKRTPLYNLHKILKGNIVPFAGWEMPIQYSSLSEEHIAVRTRAGLFDVSHMGEITITGKGALESVQSLTSNDANKLVDGQIQYSALTTHDGTFIDDLLVYRKEENDFLLVVNASNTDKDYRWMLENSLKTGAQIKNVSHMYAQIAIQGPFATGILERVIKEDLASMKYYWFIETEILNENCIVSRTGYTGEDGFEIYINPRKAERLFRALLDEGKRDGILPCGLGARDTLRLEAGMCLYGNDIDDKHTVLEADLGWICKLDKGEFNGKNALVRQKQLGIKKRLMGLEVKGGVARHGYRIFDKSGIIVGDVTSGTITPFLKKAIALAYLPSDFQIGLEVYVEIRDKKVPAMIVDKPFYVRPTKLNTKSL